MNSTGSIASRARQLRPKPNFGLENGVQPDAMIRWLMSFPGLRSRSKSLFKSRSVTSRNLAERNTCARLDVRRRQSRNPVRPLIEIATNLNSAADFHHIPTPLAFVATGGTSAAKLAYFHSEAQKPSSPDPPKVIQSNRIQPSPTESG